MQVTWELELFYHREMTMELNETLPTQADHSQELNATTV